MMTATMLEISDKSYDTQHEAHMNASGKALGAVFLQKYAMEASFYPVAYFSWKLNHA